ncbi:hypothetical protein D1AOALGA4SA_1949 [Olavius algarvensis Delta 1 endosymbiont]|nr:hypothetical protein D1AOALGA4SA_1949 [Olavius algarvensis Delta 1 endosymbiont]
MSSNIHYPVSEINHQSSSIYQLHLQPSHLPTFFFALCRKPNAKHRMPAPFSVTLCF